MRNSCNSPKVLSLSAAVGLWILAAPVHASVIVTAGSLSGVGPGTYYVSGTDNHADVAQLAAPGVIQLMDSTAYYGGETDGKIYAVLDLGSVQGVDKVVNLNRLNAPVLPAHHIQILVAADESAGGFDPAIASSFTAEVFNGELTPVTAAAAASRSADINDISRRYLLLVYTDNLDGPISTSNYQVQIGDLQVELIPEPTTSSLLLGVGGGCLALSARRRS